MSALDDLPTPELGSPVQVEPRRGRRHRVSDEPIGTLDDRVRVLEGDRKAARGIAKAALVAALGSLGGVLIWALNAREAAGYQRARAEELVKTVELLRSDFNALRDAIFAPSMWRRTTPQPPAATTPRKDSEP